MKFKCEIDKFTTLKKGMKIILTVPDEETKSTIKDIHNFMGFPLEVTFETDVEKRKELMLQITDEQRKKIYAIFKDIAEAHQISSDNAKETMTINFLQNSQYEDFSLSNCSSELAKDFIEYLIKICFENGIRLSHHPSLFFSETDKYFKVMEDKKMCVVCGKGGVMYEHICLCDNHAIELQTFGVGEFYKKYHF